MTTKPQILCTVAEAAVVLSVSKSEVKRLIYAGELERRYIGDGSKYYRIPYQSLVDYADSLPESKVEKGGR